MSLALLLTRLAANKTARYHSLTSDVTASVVCQYCGSGYQHISVYSCCFRCRLLLRPHRFAGKTNNLLKTLMIKGVNQRWLYHLK